jgi:hypothetical protein
MWVRGLWINGLPNKPWSTMINNNMLWFTMVNVAHMVNEARGLRG